MMDVSDTIQPKSDQLNADDLLAGPITVTVQDIKRGSDDQPLILVIGDGRQPYKPCKSMRRVLVAAWGSDGKTWIGRSMTLYCDPDVQFRGQASGGIRISHVSHIERPMTIQLTVTRGKRKPYTVYSIETPQQTPKRDPNLDHVRAMVRAYANHHQITAAEATERCGVIAGERYGKDLKELTQEEAQAMAPTEEQK